MFEEIFNDFINKKTKSDILKIDMLASKYDIDYHTWWTNLKKHNFGDYSGLDILDELSLHFVFHISLLIDIMLLKYLPASGTNYRGEPYISSGLGDLKFKKGKFVLDDEGKTMMSELVLKLRYSEKKKLLESKLFSDVIENLKIVFLTKSDIRALKLENINSLE